MVWLTAALALMLAQPPAGDLTPPLCAPAAQAAELAGCPDLGPGAYRAQYAAAAPPAAPPELPLCDGRSLREIARALGC